MESVRFMFNKHLKKIDLSVQTKIKPEKDYAYKPKVSDEVVFQDTHSSRQGSWYIYDYGT